MSDFILSERVDRVGLLTLNRPDVLNAWHKPMRDQLIDALKSMDNDPAVGALVLTGSGNKAFGAGQDFGESKEFDADRSEAWVSEWERLYDTIRSLSKPIVAALNGVAAGSAFQVALLCDFRIGHTGVRMGQPEIDSGIPSTTGPWIMREHLGLARTIDLTLTGRLMGADECLAIGIVNRIVPEADVFTESLELARSLAAKPAIAMRLNRQRFREMTEAGFKDCLEAGIRSQREAYASGEPARLMNEFLTRRADRKGKD